MTQTRRLWVMGMLTTLLLIFSAFALQAQDTVPPLVPGETTGTLDEDTPRTLYSLSVDSNTLITLTLESTSFDAYLVLLDEDGEIVEEDDDSAGRLNSQIDVTLAAGEYTVVATSLREYRSAGDLFDTGDYTLTLEVTETETAEVAEEVRAIAVDESIMGSLSEGDARHEYTLEITEANTTVVITLVSAEFDPYLILLDPLDNELARDDDSAGSLDSLIERTFLSPGDYTLIVSSFGEVNGFTEGYGDYTLSVETSEAIVEATPTLVPTEAITTQNTGEAQGNISIGDTVSGTLSEDIPAHTYTFEASEGDSVTIDLNGEFDTYLILLDADDNEVTRNDDGGEGLNSLIADFEIPADGTYTIYASSYGNVRGFTIGIGDYNLTLEEGGVAVAQAPTATLPPSPTPSADSTLTDEEAVVAELQGTIEFGETINSSFDDEDVQAHGYEFTANAGDQVSIALNGEFDTYLILRNSADEVVTFNDDGGEGLNSLIAEFIIPDDDTYTIIASSYQNVRGFGTSTGNYDLTLVEGGFAVVQATTPTPTLIPMTPTPTPDVDATLSDEDAVAAVAVLQGTIEFGETINSSFDDEDVQAHGYEFTANAGDVVTIALNGEFDTYLVLTNSADEVVTFNDDGGDGLNSRIADFVIPADDTYTIIASSYGFVRVGTIRTGTYDLTLSDENTVLEVTPTEEVPSGDPIVVMGTIVPGIYTDEMGNGLGQAHEYTFSGNAGDVVTITVTSEDFDTQVFLFDTDYFTIASNDDADDITLGLNSQLVDIELPATGDYIIGVTSYDWVEGIGDVTGEYTLEFFTSGDAVVQVTPTPTQVAPPVDAERIIGSIEYGDSVTGTLSDSSGLAHLYTFDGTAMDVITADLSSEIIDTYLILRFEDGSEVTFDDDGGEGLDSRIENFELPQTGEYTLVASSYGYVRGFTPGEGDYSLTLTSSSSEFVSDPTEIVLGDTVSGFLEEREVTEDFSLFAEAGDQIVITLTSEQFDTYLFLFDEDRNELARDDDSAGSLDSRIGPFTIPEDGIYTIQVNSFQNVTSSTSSAFGEFVLSVEAVEAQPIEYTQTVTGSLSDPGESSFQVYSFVGEAGDLVAVEFTANADAPYIRLTGQGIDQQTFGGGNQLNPITLPADGEYTITVTTYDAFIENQNFTLTVNVIEPVVLELGEEIDANFDDASRLYFEFEGEAQDVISAMVRSGGSVDTVLSIIGPNGFEVFYDDDSGAGFDPEILAFTLPEDGTYTVVIRPYIAGDNGDFTFMVDESGTPPIDTQTQIIRLSDKQRIAGVVFDAEAGETVRVSVRLLTPNSGEPRITISQDGDIIASNSVGQVSRLLLEFTVEEDGEVLVEANDVNFTSAILELSVERVSD